MEKIKPDETIIEFITNFPITIMRVDKKGWGPAGPNATNTETLLFNVYIDMSLNKYRLSCISCNQELDDDSLHDSIEDLKEYAYEMFDINNVDWKNT